MPEEGQYGEWAGRILEGTADGLCVLGEGGRVLCWNPAMAEATGIAAGEAVGRPILELLPELPRSAAWSELERGLAGQQVWPQPW